MLSNMQQRSSIYSHSAVQSRQRLHTANVLPLLYDDVMANIAEVHQEIVHVAKEQVAEAGLQVSGLSAGYCFTQYGISANDLMAPDLVDRDTVEDVGACLISQTYEFPFEEEELTPEVYRVLNQYAQNQTKVVQQRLQQEMLASNDPKSGHNATSRRRRAQIGPHQPISDVLGGQEILAKLIRSSSHMEMITMLKNIFWQCIDNCKQQNTFLFKADSSDECFLYEGLATATFSGEITVTV